MSKPYRLLAPGPVPVPPAVLRAMSEKVVHHRTPEFEKILRSAWAGLKKVFETNQPVLILAGTGSAAMEAAVVNLLSPGEEALVVVSGKFGERWAEMCERYEVKTTRLNVEWGAKLDLAEFKKILSSKKFAAVFSQVCETSTATLHPIQEMARLIKAESTALFAVDAITGVGCTPLPMDEWQIDCIVAGSQKAFMIPTGLSFIALSEAGWKAQARSKIKKFYFDLAAERKANEARGETFFSTPSPLVIGLNEVLQQMEKAGFNQVHARCALLAEVTRTTAEALGLKVFSQSPSPSVTALTTPSDSGKIRDRLESEYNITIMGGQDQQKGKILRIGHMGDIRDGDMLALFEALAEILGKTAAWPELKKQMTAQLQATPALFRA